MPPDVRAIAGVDDSKQLRAPERQRLAIKIRERAISVGIGAASVREIDRVNIYHATVIAMRRALSRLSVTPHHVLVDGKPIRTLEVPHTAFVGGDDVCYTIACASIVAKVTRDRIMQSLAGRYPLYLWERNVGYSTLAHLQGLAAHGVTPHHRRSFIPVRQLSLDFVSTGEVAAPLDAEALAADVDIPWPGAQHE
jgi:ribonuclease HII